MQNPSGPPAQPAQIETVYHTPMPENSKGTTAYRCECGKKWTFKNSDLTADSTQPCNCGRTIMVYKGGIFGTRKK